MPSSKLHALYGLKWNPFLPDVPTQIFAKSQAVEKFHWRLESLVREGGFALLTGEPGSGKSVALRQTQSVLKSLGDVSVQVINRPQNNVRDFYIEMAHLYGFDLKYGSRYGNFNSLRCQWAAKLKSTSARPILLIDEAQEVPEVVLSELRLLTSAELDSKNLLAVVLAGDRRLLDKLRQPALLPLESRIKLRCHLEARTPAELEQMLCHLLAESGAPNLLTVTLSQTLAENSMGNPRAMMVMAGELLAAAMQKEERQITEDLFFEIFNNSLKKPAAKNRSAPEASRFGAPTKDRIMQ